MSYVVYHTTTAYDWEYVGQTAMLVGENPTQAVARRLARHEKDPQSALGPHLVGGEKTTYYGPYALEATALAEEQRIYDLRKPYGRLLNKKRPG